VRGEKMATVEPIVAIASADPKFAPQLGEKLVSNNCRVIIVSDMERLAERVKEGEVHVAVVDLDMSYGDFRHVVKDLKGLDRHLELIVAAEHCSERDEIYLRSSGVLYVAFKPAEPEPLARIVKESARKAARQRYC